MNIKVTSFRRQFCLSVCTPSKMVKDFFSLLNIGVGKFLYYVRNLKILTERLIIHETFWGTTGQGWSGDRVVAISTTLWWTGFRVPSRPGRGSNKPHILTGIFACVVKAARAWIWPLSSSSVKTRNEYTHTVLSFEFVTLTEIILLLSQYLGVSV
jgi:hypothetical protein